MLTQPEIGFFTPSTPAQFDITRDIFREYAAQLHNDQCFRDFTSELQGLPGEYTAPQGALIHATADGKLAGCCALRPLPTVDGIDAAEMKRLCVRDAYRRLDLGRQLDDAVLDAARVAGYRCVLLDTLDNMQTARALYEDPGFQEIPSHYHNLIAGTHV